MRIGLITPPWIPVPPEGCGGTEAIVDNLARGLTQLGHDVRLHPTAVEPMNDAAAEITHLVAAYRASHHGRHVAVPLAAADGA